MCIESHIAKFLAQQLQVTSLSTDDGKVIYATEGINVLATMTNADLTSLAPSSHEEADRHLLYMLEMLYTKATENCAYAQYIATDVVALAILMNCG